MILMMISWAALGWGQEGSFMP